MKPVRHETKTKTWSNRQSFKDLKVGMKKVFKEKVKFTEKILVVNLPEKLLMESPIEKEI